MFSSVSVLNGCCKILLSNVFNLRCYQVSFYNSGSGFSIIKVK